MHCFYEKQNEYIERFLKYTSTHFPRPHPTWYSMNGLRHALCLFTQASITHSVHAIGIVFFLSREYTQQIKPSLDYSLILTVVGDLTSFSYN